MSAGRAGAGADERTEFCMDLRDGKHEAGAIIQIWTCGDGNPNQMWSMSESGPWISKEEPEEE